MDERARQATKARSGAKLGGAEAERQGGAAEERGRQEERVQAARGERGEVARAVAGAARAAEVYALLLAMGWPAGAKEEVGGAGPGRYWVGSAVVLLGACLNLRPRQLYPQTAHPPLGLVPRFAVPPALLFATSLRHPVGSLCKVQVRADKGRTKRRPRKSKLL